MVNPMSLICETLLIGVTGSIGAVKVHEYIFKLNQLFAQNVFILMSHSAQKFVTPSTLQLFTKSSVFTDDFEIIDDIHVPHIELAQKTDMFLIMPATANIIGKAAGGICDDLISTTIVSCQTPIVFAPNMNEAMWFDKIVQRNVQILKDVEYFFIEPTYGYEISNMEKGYGTMPPFDTVLLSLEMILATAGDGEKDSL
jgi:phosphopantothenoylcysteine decarboxylase/phosphopantothenate--cysteine ligase